jgi:hypothetical protein
VADCLDFLLRDVGRLNTKLRANRGDASVDAIPQRTIVMTYRRITQ